MQQLDNLDLKFVDSIAAIGEKQWNGLAGTENPFTRYEFLWALEKTGCTTQETGWSPHHVAVFSGLEGDKKRKLIAIMPLYRKTNSYGEYVFDWSWASAYQNYGLDYYPKFVSAIPFTPSHGARIFTDASVSRQDIVQLIYEKLKAKAESISASSWHILFPTEEENKLFEAAGIPARTACQFHWFNRGYISFDDFLATLNSRKRKNIRRERQKVAEQGASFETIAGIDITSKHWDTFYRFYQSTYMMRGMQGYLSQEFFAEIGRHMPEQLFMVAALDGEEMIAAALFFKNSEKIFGRYWGSARDYQFLHFETCYYQGQEYCIQHKLKSFDSGAQGEHKIQRGFEPIITYSNHWIANEGFAQAINNFLDEERAHIEKYKAEASSLLPFKKGN
ncbi:MAG: GNAT family N-acetyltransferase [SAR86 cluster bacterium]|uniref:GNAT family N-acetyltransferase n=1 Tax=SAR86 cluster bacterium TaxID=2030880 RepID=A0A2A4X486_9GAMM|nr:MAG: GNAT family N-acetyltransferase [SAR86 cluster bacterium]